tara:strand:- start:1356 stop:1751 length:396 start_codon:yes stop_codon:yes gene_type:complete
LAFETLNNENWIMYAIKAYEKPNYVLSEFKDDLKRINYLKRLFRRYRKQSDIKERLVLNHLIVLTNVFGPIVTSRLLFFKVAEEDHSILKTYLTFLNIMPDKITGIEGKDIHSSSIQIDMGIAEKLRKIDE